jgi:hypothetical protein
MTAHQEESNGQHGHPIEIIVNAQPHLVHTERLTFEEVVRLAFSDAVFSDQIVYTVTYKRGPLQNPEGSLVAGEAVFIKIGMIFNAKRTDKS